MRVSLVLAIMNIAPVPYLDGGHAITAILDAWRLAMPPLPDYVSPFVFFVYISSFRSVDIELFEMDWETGDI
jgi:membrane-associated protease RseP (regulator of RpoE activity)